MANIDYTEGREKNRKDGSINADANASEAFLTAVDGGQFSANMGGVDHAETRRTNVKEAWKQFRAVLKGEKLGVDLS